MRPVLAAILALAACELPNPDHCVHKHVDSDDWCARNDPARPFCSPCEVERHGCVAARPAASECPAYEPDTTGQGDALKDR